jgi:adenylate cyclase
MDWDAEGLLDGLENPRARAVRAALLAELHESGVPAEELRRAVAEDRLALLPVERLLTSEPQWSAREIAERSGMELDVFVASRRALGFPVPDPDETAFGQADLEAAELAARYSAVFPGQEAIEVTRVLGQGMARYAEAIRALASHTLLEPGIDERELAHRYEAVGRALLPLAAPLLEHALKLHVREVLREDAITREQLEAGGAQDTQDTTVAFADLVGFTALGETVDTEELTGVAERLAELTGRLVEPPVRLVKQIGDAVMLVSPDAEAMVRTVLALVDEGAADEAFPSLRAGVAYGPAINRWGDWYGSTVNVASRLTARARPASVLATDAVREQTGGAYSWSSAGSKKLRGLTTPVKTFRVRRDDGG